MSLLIVGADHLGNIEKNLRDSGVEQIEHIQGRNVCDKRKLHISQTTSLVIVFTDYINHLTAQNVKKQAKAQKVPVVFAKRSWRALEQQLYPMGFCGRPKLI